MKKTLLGLITLLMLTPVMACAMSYCPMQTQAKAQTAEKAQCHESRDGKTTNAPMLTLDCMGVDLFQSDESTTPQPENTAFKDIIFTWADTNNIYNMNRIITHPARAPPTDIEPETKHNYLILTTQRIRI